jgi:hypothetical protein
MLKTCNLTLQFRFQSHIQIHSHSKGSFHFQVFPLPTCHPFVQLGIAIEHFSLER